jgi:electron transfer flavoprotein beta subunit
VTRRGDRGARQRVTLSFPCAVLFDPGVREPRYPSLEALLEGLEAEVEVWGLPDLGLARREVGEQGSTLTDAHFAFPRPNPVRVVTPDARLNAIERMQALLSGGIQPREAVVHLGSAEETAEGLFRIFCEEGLLPDGGD